MPCRATQDGGVIVESADKTWSSGEGNGNPLQYSCLETPMDREAWPATVHGVARVRHDLATEQQQQPSLNPLISLLGFLV